MFWEVDSTSDLCIGAVTGFQLAFGVDSNLLTPQTLGVEADFAVGSNLTLFMRTANK